MAHKDGSKSGGRKKGTPNKVTTERKDLIRELLFDDWEQMVQDFKKLSAKERIDAKIKLMSFVIAKMQSTANIHSINFDDLNDEQIDKLFNRIIRD